MTGISASSQPVAGAGTDVRARRGCAERSVAERQAERDESEEREDLERREQVVHEAAGPRPLMWTSDRPTIAVIATIACGVTTSGAHGIGIVSSGVRVGRGRNEAADVVGERDGAGGDGAGESGDERRPAGQERRERAVRVAQVDVLAAGARPQRGQLRVRHRAGKREQAAEQPDGRASPSRSARCRATRIGHEEDAAADDVGDDDGGRIERAEPPLERRAARRGGW